ncbi:endonuclease [Allostella sp. ATCC 35155]|nr:endonuclease [Stella sp. ATCC 35155]
MLAVTAMLGWTGPAAAWGEDGHRVIAGVAERLLTPRAAGEVARLLRDEPGGGATLVTVSTWADEIRRERRETGPFHYVNVQVWEAGYVAERDCPDGRCSVAALDRFVGILKDRQSLPAARAEALKWVIHIVADMHQPLHAGDAQDRGGNDVKLVLAGRPTNLHAVWDVDVVAPLMREPGAPLVDRLLQSLTPIEEQAWQQGGSERWTAEAHAIARDVVYPAVGNLRGGTQQPIVLPPTYPADQAPVVRQQLLRAGVRLATVLNAVLR